MYYIASKSKNYYNTLFLAFIKLFLALHTQKKNERNLTNVSMPRKLCTQQITRTYINKYIAL